MCLRGASVRGSTGKLPALQTKQFPVVGVHPNTRAAVGDAANLVGPPPDTDLVHTVLDRPTGFMMSNRRLRQTGRSGTQNPGGAYTSVPPLRTGHWSNPSRRDVAPASRRIENDGHRQKLRPTVDTSVCFDADVAASTGLRRANAAECPKSDRQETPDCSTAPPLPPVPSPVFRPPSRARSFSLPCAKIPPPPPHRPGGRIVGSGAWCDGQSDNGPNDVAARTRHDERDALAVARAQVRVPTARTGEVAFAAATAELGGTGLSATPRGKRRRPHPRHERNRCQRQPWRAPYVRVPLRRCGCAVGRHHTRFDSALPHPLPANI